MVHNLYTCSNEKCSESIVISLSDSKVEPLDPPQSCKPGDRVFVEGFEQITCGRKLIQEMCASYVHFFLSLYST